jgi:SAM-dependent methyltransferase
MPTAHVQSIYERRFEGTLPFRRAMWSVLCRDFFQRFVPPTSTVLEIGAGYCEFINHIDASRKIAVDLNPDTVRFAAEGVKVHRISTTDLSPIPDGSVDVVFASNFLEHLTRDDILATCRETRRILASDGKFLILQPNIRYCGHDYWQFFDHITPLDDRSLSEALALSGLRVVTCIQRFLPFTTQSRLPHSLFFVRLYLKIPFAWRIFGQQSFLIAVPAPAGGRPASQT